MGKVLYLKQLLREAVIKQRNRTVIFVLLPAGSWRRVCKDVKSRPSES